MSRPPATPEPPYLTYDKRSFPNIATGISYITTTRLTFRLTTYSAFTVTNIYSSPYVYARKSATDCVSAPASTADTQTVSASSASLKVLQYNLLTSSDTYGTSNFECVCWPDQYVVSLPMSDVCD